MYESPIEMLITDIQHQIEKQRDEEIYKAVVNFIPNIEKDELIRALQYDREQYDKGYADGKADAMAELVRCKDCVYNANGCCTHSETYDDTKYRPDYFCADGERRTDNGC